MLDFFKVFTDFNTKSRELIVSLFVTCSFWIVPICLFKTEIFNLPFYAQMALIFALALMWFFVTFFVSVFILHVLDKETENTLTLVAFISAVLLCIAILISYYYSNSFTYFLRVAYSVQGVFLGFQIIVLTILELRYKTVSKILNIVETKDNSGT